MISVLVANYNNSKFLVDCIASIYNQLIQSFEIEVVVCDDFSADDSLIILRGLQSVHGFQLLTNNSNIGVGATKWRLVEASKGEWLIFLDSDDKLELNCLQKLHDCIGQHAAESLSMVYANSRQIMHSGDCKEWNRSKPFYGSLLESKFEYPIFHPIIYNRNKYLLTKGIDINLRSADDYDLWYKMEEVGKVLFLNECLYQYRINLNGVSQVGDDLNKWLQVMLEHSWCSANAASRRGLNVRKELNEFAEIISNRMINTNKRGSNFSIFKSRIRGLFRFYY